MKVRKPCIKKDETRKRSQRDVRRLERGGRLLGAHLGTLPTPLTPHLSQRVFHSAQVSLTMRNQDGGHCNPSGFLVSSFFV